MNKRLCKKYSIVSKVLYHCKITKCIFDCFYLFWCRMFPRLFQFFYRIRSIIHRQSQISLYLCDICGMYLEAVFRFYVLLNHFVGHFFFGLVRFGSFSNTIYRNLALALSKLHINVDITVGFFVGQKNYRLIVQYIKEHTPENAIVFLTGIGKCYPILRSHKVLNNLHQAFVRCPVVMFFPGTYNEQELILFNEIKDDNYYRAFRLVK